MAPRWQRVPLRREACFLMMAIVVFGSLALAFPKSNWRFGQVQLTPLGAGTVLLYMSLHNTGHPSAEAVSLMLVAPGATPAVDTPEVSLTRFTSGQRSTVVRLRLQLPATLPSPANYRLFLRVEQTVTDMLPVVDGRPVPQDTARKQFQR
ncbi:MAG: hypothetical protein KatS3mg131_0938 [Candidatus Tectimicrobiota bacterium]|nr:MAG: hypothetical protein KatS3mg131_0938 [Candidatus Tectomicrobia bacterium]